MRVEVRDERHNFDAFEIPFEECFEKFLLSDEVAEYDVVAASVFVVEHPEIPEFYISDFLEN